MVDPGLVWGIKNERSNEARVSETTALSRDEIFMFKSLFFFLYWWQSVKCEGESAWVKDWVDLGRHNPSN